MVVCEWRPMSNEDGDEDVPGMPSDPPPPGPPEPPKKPSMWWMLGRPPLFWSYWLLVGLAEVGSVWLFGQMFPPVAAFLDGSLVTAVAALVLKDSFTEEPPHRL